jgi:hypothetical protein
MKIGIGRRISTQEPKSPFEATRLSRGAFALQLRVLRLGLLQDGDVDDLLHRNGSHLLRREANAAQEVIEAWIGAQRVPDRVHF